MDETLGLGLWTARSRWMRLAALMVSAAVLTGLAVIHQPPLKVHAASPGPVVYAITPDTGSPQGGTQVRIFGSGFTGATVVKFGAVSSTTSGCFGFFIAGDTQIFVLAPAQAAGTVDVVVTGPGGSSAITAADRFTYATPGAPVVYGVNPSSGQTGGGDFVTIFGTGFANASKVLFGSTTAPFFYRPSDAAVVVQSPGGASGTVDITVTTPIGTSATTAADKFTYMVPGAPVVQNVSPNHATAAGKVPVFITGTGFLQAIGVSFGGTALSPGSFQIISDTSIYTVAPPGTAASTVDVTVTNGIGSSATTSADRFSYAAVTAPVIYGLTVSHGPTVGGTLVEIRGSGLAGATNVMFGSNAAAGLNQFYDNFVDVTSPPGASGAVDVTVTTPAGTSATTAADRFTYVTQSVPVVFGVDPHTGSTAGGTFVSIFGDGFTSGSTVKFGPNPGTHVQVFGSTNLTVLSPAGSAGTVDITVTNQAGASATGIQDQYTYLAAGVPVVRAVIPNRGFATGGTSVTVFGDGFTQATAVHFGTLGGTRLSVFNDNSLFVVSPAGTAGTTVDITVTTPAGTSSPTGVDQFSYVTPVAPTITAVSPSTGPASGGTNVWITGSALSGATAVHFGLSQTFQFFAQSDSLIRVFNVPAGSGTVDITVTTPGGTSATGSADQYIYAAPVAPAITAVSPSSGPANSNTTVYVSGSNLGGATGVTFGGTPAGFYVNSNGLITAFSPSGSAGPPVDVQVTTPGGTSPITANDQFTFTTPVTPPPPTVTAVSPNSGPPQGGTTVYIRGTNFVGVAVKFGTTPAFPTLVTNGLISVSAPAGTPSSTVDITVTTPSGSSATSPSDQFIYGAAAAPVVTGISPATGPAAGGTIVYITGSGFGGSPTVSFGGTPATIVSIPGDTLLAATSPAGTGTVHVTVTNVGMTSATSASDQFVYGGPAPSGLQVNGVAPNKGPNAGGTSVNIFGLGFSAGVVNAVKFGGAAAQYFFRLSDTQVVASAPPGSVGSVDITVTVGSTTSAVTTADRFTYTAPVRPVVNGVDPNQGSSFGGTSVTVFGSGFSGASSVRFGGAAANGFFVQDDTRLQAFSPPGIANTSVDIAVTNSAGTSAPTSADSFSFVTQGPPTVNAVDPSSGTALGKTQVQIYGSNLGGVTSVKFGGVPAASFFFGGNNNIFVTSPPGTAGTTVDVTVTTPIGTSATSPADKYSYFTPPVPRIDAVDPNRGGLNGGNRIGIFGSGFSGATTVQFGASPATQVYAFDDGSLSVTSPPGVAGVADVTVTTPGGTSTTHVADQFTYYAAAAPSISAVSPNTGAARTLVWLTGSGLADVNTVQFGASGCTGPNAPFQRSDNALAVYAPTGATGTVDITVTTPEGTSAITASDHFTYTAPSAPSVTAVAPAAGPAAGGTLVFITGSGLATATAVTFGSAPAVPTGFRGGFFAIDDSLIEAVSPAGTAGTTVDVQVTTPAGTSPPTTADRFTYNNPSVPSVIAVRPSSGPSGGGSTVFITASGIDGLSNVQFGTSSGAQCGIPFIGAQTASLHAVQPPQPRGAQTRELAGNQRPTQVPTLQVPVLTRVPVHTPAPGATKTAVIGPTYTTVQIPSQAQVQNLAGQPASPTPRQSALAEQAAQAASTGACSFARVGESLIEAISPAQGTNPATVDVTVTTGGGTSATSSADQFSYTATATPTVSAVAPASGPSGGGTTVYISGSDLTNATAVHFGSVGAATFNQNQQFNPIRCSFFLCPANDSSIQVISPPGTNPSTVDVTVTTAGGTSATGSADQFTYGATPVATVAAVAPGSGPIGTAVFITGTGFTNAAAVIFGSVGASRFSRIGDTLILVPSPAQAIGTVDVTVVTAGGTSATSTADKYTYTASPTPVVAAIGPASGPTPGGTGVYITGTGFTGTTAVAFGGTAATKFTVVTDHLILAVSPAGAGNVDITVTTPGGTSATSSADLFAYVTPPAPTVTSVVPNTGPAAGGTPVTITGTNFIGVTSVKFGSAAATGVTVNSPTQITATSPPGSGTVHITVTAAGGTSAASAADQFTYGAGRCTNATLTSSKASPQSGGPVTFIAAAAGPGCTNPLFQFWTWQPSTGWVMQQAYSSANTWLFDTTGTAPGTTISVDVWVEQAGSSTGPNNYETFGLEAWSIGGCDSATMSSNPATATGTVIFTATAHGAACGTPMFQFWMWSPATSWVLEQSYSTTNTWSLDTTTLPSATTYSIDVWVKQAGSPMTYETWALSTLPKGVCGSSTVAPAAGQASPQPVGLTVNFTATAPGCTAPQYRYWIYPGAGGTWQMLRDYSTDPTYPWNTNGLKPGTYSIVVHVLQTGSTAVYDTDALYAYSVTGASSATLVAAPASPQPSGGTVVFTGNAPGSAVQYQFWTYPPGGPWTSHTFSSNATFTWNTTGLSPGTYAWVVYVVQTGSANSYDSWALLSFTVT